VLPNYEGNLDINNVVIPKPVQIKSRQTGITVPKIILAGSHLGSAYSFHILSLSKYGSLNLFFILLVTVSFRLENTTLQQGIESGVCRMI